MILPSLLEHLEMVHQGVELPPTVTVVISVTVVFISVLDICTVVGEQI